MKPILFFSILSVIIFSSCNYVIGKIGNGHIIKQNRSVGSFTAVEANGAVNVYLRQDFNHSVTIEADENLQDYILVYDEGDDIVITTKKGRNIRPSRKIKVYITSPEFRQVKVSGAVNIYGQNKIIGTESISFRSSGAGSVKYKGNATVSEKISGAGSVKKWIKKV